MTHVASPNTPLIVARGLTKIYLLGVTEVVGVRDIDLDVSPGELVVLKGNSGSGKSTLLSLLGGLDTPTVGTLHVAGRDLTRATETDLTQFRRRHVGIVFQSFNLLPTLTVLENVALPALLAGDGFKSVQERARTLLNGLKLGARLHHQPSQLSGGEMQRTALARALINAPPLILADEPTGNLDTRNGEIVIDLLTRLNRDEGRTVIIATHSTLADTRATLHVTLRDGAIIETHRVLHS